MSFLCAFSQELDDEKMLQMTNQIEKMNVLQE